MGQETAVLESGPEKTEESENTSLQPDSTSERLGMLIVDSISITGNRRTINRIIFRELDFKEGDTLFIADTSHTFKRNRNQVFNTGLFVTTNIKADSINGNHCRVAIHVKEEWYIFPMPILELADRNFNEWINQNNMSLSRINFGIRFRHENFRGRNERLKIVLQGGFTDKYELEYILPNINKKQTTGLGFKTTYATQKAVAFTTGNDKLKYWENEDVVKTRLFTGLSITKRQRLYTKHLFSLGFNYQHVQDSIAILNPNYFLDGRTDVHFLTFSYSISWDRRDIHYYPLKGKNIEAGFTKYGLGVFGDLDAFRAYGKFGRFWQLSKHYYFATKVSGQFSLPNKLPYFISQGLGYDEDLVRGFELQVVDGQHYLLSRNELRRRLFKTTLHFNFFPVKEFRTVPLAIYLKGFSDLGYVIDSQSNDLTVEATGNILKNSFLWGNGIGIDIISYYDAVLRLEYSVTNKKGIHGFFFHLGGAF